MQSLHSPTKKILNRVHVISRKESMATRQDTTSGFNPTEPTSDARAQGTLQHQETLPKMPLPPLDQVVEKYLATIVPALSAEEAASARAAADKFMNGDGPYLYSKLQEYDASHVNYIEDFYREIYTGAEYSNYSLNPNFVLEPNPKYSDAASMAAMLTSSVLQHHFSIRTGQMPPTMTKKGALCMRQMPWTYGTARIALPNSVDDTVNFIDSSKHIVVLCNGSFYKLRVLDDDFNIVASPELLKQRFSEIAAHAKQSSGSNLGILTTAAERPQWEEARAKLMSTSPNKESIETIDSAIILVALDSVSGLSVEDMERNVLYGLESTVANRWLDKATMIVCEDGMAGLNWEHSMLDGQTMMEMFAEVASEFTCGAPIHPSESVCTVTPLELQLDQATQALIPSLMSQSLQAAQRVGVEVLEYRKFGSTFIKGCKCSPDGFMQTALMLTFYGMRGRHGMPYESVLAKAFKHGRVTVARNLSPLIAKNVESFDAISDPEARRDLFRGIVGDVSRICREAASAQEFDRPFLALRRIAALEGKHMDICEEAAWGKLNDLDLCTSHCGRKPIRLFGYEPPAEDGFSVGYFLTADAGQFCITHFDKKAAADFKQQLEARLDQLHQLFA